MAQKLETKIERRRLADLIPLTHNAHYMDKREFDQLTDNIRRDGVLTSLPVVYDTDTPGEILSGNHRVKAGIQAGVEEADCLVILSPLTKEQKLGIQLSHNSIHGKDDPNLLRTMYDQILSLDFKQYSGLTDDDFKIAEVDLVPLSFSQPETEDVTIAFLTADKEIFLREAKRIGNLAEKNTVLTASMADFDTFHEAVFRVRSKFGIINLALALKVMAEMALVKLAELGAEEDADQDTETGHAS